jgi:hypothetical protein
LRKIRNPKLLLLASIVISVAIVSSVATVLLVKAQNPDFSLTTTPSSLSIQAGTCATKTITVTSLNGFSGVVTLSSFTSPSSPGVAETITPTSVVLASNSSATATKTVCASASAPAECQTETIVGTSGSFSHAVSEQDCVTTNIPPPPQLFTYTAKWICYVPVPGVTFNPAGAEAIGLVPGEYKTDINVHNPSFFNQTLTLNKKFVVSVPEAPFVNATRVAFIKTILAPDGAFFVDCREILATLGLPLGKPFKGFLVIVTTTQNLNVVAEYSAESFNANTGVSTGISLEVETIPSGPFIP